MQTEAEQRLAEVRQAIKEVMSKGQRLRKGDREIQRAELASLRVLENQYLNQVTTELARSRGRNRISYLSI
ncbi:hypothetical protein QMA71_19465 [Pseudomonas otitidis]|uniref:hypothetical protein n=1 Tax=Metapseudomonas otitidis TaxID=319939 RepID=UPI0024ACAAD9|nr:hypothetical protein [Pseudomonas otitidis]MDI6527722.1 hypothetical protein [Pseudomonas otitidis]